MVITTEVRNVLPDAHARTQRFWTQVDDYNQYFTYIRSDGAGEVQDRYFDRGGPAKVPCPDATVRLWPGPRKERVVQTVPLCCIRLSGEDIAFTSTTSVLPKGPRWFIAKDWTRRTSEIHLDPQPE